MLCDASDFCSHCRTILYSWNQRKKCGNDYLRTADRNSSFAGRERHRRWIYGLEIHFLCRSCVNGSLCHYHYANIARYSFQLQRQIQRLDEITSLLGDGLSAAAHLVPPCRHSIRLFFGFMEFIGFQDGASPFLCRQQCNRLVGFMWHYGSFDGLFYRPVCAYPGGKTTELYRLQPLVYCMAFTLYRTKFVCRHYLRHLTDRYRYAMYPAQ